MRINDLLNEKNNIKKKENDELMKKQKEENKKKYDPKKKREYKFKKYQTGLDIPENVYEDRNRRLKFTDINKFDIMDVLGINNSLKALKQFPIFHNEKRKYQDKTDSIKVDYIDSAKNLVDHANRLFLYKSRTTPVTNVINNEESVKRLDRKLNKLKQIQKSNVKLGSLEAEVESKINNNLDRIIKGIRAQEGEKKNDFLSFK